MKLISNYCRTPAMNFALLANGAAAVFGLVTGFSLLGVCIFLFFGELVVLAIGVPLWIRDCKDLNWRRNTCVFLLLFTPYIAGLAVAVSVHQLYHLAEERDVPAPPPPLMPVPADYKF